MVSDAGTPCISDPGYILIKKAKKEHIKVYSIGGISAVISALSISGLDSSKFTFHGFFPKETKDRKNLLEEIKKSEIKTHIFYESPKRIITTLKLLSDNINNITVSVSKELSKINEKNYYGNINQVIKELEKDEKTSLGEYTFIIEKENIEIKQETISLEALLIDKLVKEHISLKEAVKKLNNEYKNLRKKDLYQASLNLKEILKRN